MPSSCARFAIPRPAGGGVMKVSSPKFIEPDSTPEMSGLASRPGRALLDRHVVRAAGRDHREDRASGADAVDHIDEELGPSARRAVVLADVEVSDRRAGLPRLDRRVRDLLGRVRDVRVVLAKDVRAGDGAGDDHGIRVPAHQLSVLQRGALFVGDRDGWRFGRDPRGRFRTQPRPAPCPRRPGSARASSGSTCPARRLRTRRVTEPSSGSIAPSNETVQRPTTYSSRLMPALRQKGVAALLEIGEDDGVVHVAESIDVAPAHLHAVGAHAAAPQRDAHGLA